MRFVRTTLAAVCLSLSPALRADSIDLSATDGTAPGTVTLQWTGDQPLFELYRSTSPSAVVSPANLLVETSVRIYEDAGAALTVRASTLVRRDQRLPPPTSPEHRDRWTVIWTD